MSCLYKSIRYAACGLCSFKPSFIEYSLGRKYDKFQATIGVSDNAKNAEQVGFFAVYVDGDEVGRWEVRFGEYQEIEVPVTGGLRLRLEAGSADGKVNSSDLVWGTPKLYSYSL